MAGYCFDCIAKNIGFKNQIEMFKTFLEKQYSPFEISERIGVDYHTALNQMRKLELIKKGSWGGPRFKKNFIFKDQTHHFLKAR